MSSPGDDPSRIVAHANMRKASASDILEQTLGIPTSASTMLNDALETLNELMADPLRDTIAELMEALGVWTSHELF